MDWQNVPSTPAISLLSESSAGAPTARSGHRVAVYKQKALLFGGFYDAGKEVRYYSDMYELDLEELTWTPIGKPGDFQPSARSACQLAVHESTMVLM